MLQLLGRARGYIVLSLLYALALYYYLKLKKQEKDKRLSIELIS